MSNSYYEYWYLLTGLIPQLALGILLGLVVVGLAVRFMRSL